MTERTRAVKGPPRPNLRVVDHPWLERRILNYGHQGGSREAPSSTLHAFERAVANGADALEMDVHRTADGVLVVCHDASVDRTTDGTGAIADLTLSQLLELDNAYWWAPGHDAIHDLPEDGYPLRGRAPAEQALRVATLAEVLAAHPDIPLNFDIKQTAPEVAPYEAELAGMLADFGRVDDVIVASFHDAALAAFRAVAPHVPTSFALQEAFDAVMAIRAGRPVERTAGQVALQLPHRFGDELVVDATLVAGAHAQGIAVHVWTVDDPADMAQLVEIGVDGIMTDVPSVLARVLREVG